MKRFKLIAAWFIVFLNAALLIQVLFHKQLNFPVVLQIVGRLHPALLHLPIGLMLLVCGLLIFSTNTFRSSSQSMMELLLPLTAILTVLSALSGVALSTEEGYAGDVLFRHMNFGTSLSILAALLHFANDNEKFKIQVIRGLSFLAFVVVVLTGHYGSVITHGEDFITGVLKKPGENSGAETITDSTTLFTAAVMPVLDKKCNSCHNPSKKKGGLDMTTAERLLEGGEDGAVWVPYKPEESLMLQRIHLPAENEDHMPPTGKAQLTKEEITILRLFISSGADVSRTIASAEEGDSLRMFATRSASASQPTARFANLSFADPKTIKDLNTPSRSVAQLSLDEPALIASFFLAARFNENSIKELSPVADQLVEINLSGMPVTIETLKELSKFPNLNKINLNKTPLTDDMLIECLKSIGSLEVISLASTNVTLKGLKELTKKNGIKSVYLWDTQVKPEEFSSLRKDFPSIEWNEGFRPDEKEMLRLTPPILVNENRILPPNETIKLKHNLPGVSIRYLVNSDVHPDSVHGDVYAGPLRVTGPTTIRARAVKAGWKSSTLMEASFFTSGVKPATAKLLTPPNKDYRAKGSETLIDATAGDQENFRDGQWLGYKENVLSAEFDFGEPKSLGTVAVSYLKNIGSYIMPPLSIEVWGGDLQGQYQKVGSLKPIQPLQYDPNLTEAARIPVNATYKYWKVVVTPVSKLPLWHGGKGDKGWVMIDEIFFYEKSAEPIL